MTILIFAVGVMAIFSIQKELRPSVSIDKVVVVTTYTGASPVEMEKLVTIPIEEDLSPVYGIDEIESLSYTGVSQLTISIDPDVNDKSNVIQEIFRAVGNVKDLPEEVEDPIVFEIKSQVFPIYGFAVYGDSDDFILRKWAENFKDEIEMLSGVSSAEITGVRDPTIDVIVDPGKLQKHSISVSEIMLALNSWNRSAPAGYIKSDKKEIPIRVAEDLDEIGKVSKVIIRANDMGEGVIVRDVGEVKWGFKNNRKLNRYNGKKNVQITISKKENADTIQTVRSIKKLISELEKKLPAGMKTVEFRDDSVRIKTKLGSVNQNALLGLILVVVILLLMLNWRIALVTALGLPVAFFGSIWALAFLGYTLNSMTIIGIILVVGMLVDDGVVVAENIFFHFEKGKSRRDAAIDGTFEIIIPVIGTVLTTIVAFFPLIFMSGIIGKFMSIIPVAVITCLIFSLFECVLILPNHSAEFMGSGKTRVTVFLNNLLLRCYRPILMMVVRRRWIITPAIFGATIFVLIYFIATFRMQMFPVRGITSFSFNIQGPANTRIEETDQIVKKLEEKVSKCLGKYITGYRSKVGSLDGRRGMSFQGTNTAGFKLYLLGEEELGVSPRVVVQKLRKQVRPLIPEEWDLSFEVRRHGPPIGKAVEIEISHNDYKKIEEVTEKIKSKLSMIKGATDVEDDLLTGFKEYVLEIDQQKASILGVDPLILQKTMMSSFEGMAATKVRKLDDEYDVMVMYPMEYREDISNVMSLKIKTKFNTYVSISKVAKLVPVDAIGAIKHINKKRTVVVMASLRGKKVTAYEINKKMSDYVDREVRFQYPEVKINFGGEEEKRREMVTELMQLFLLAMIAIYMILSLVFRSALYPFFVILIIPFGFVGALFALRLYGEIVSLPALISFVGLTGVVINDAIILVTYIRDRYHEARNMVSSVIEGGLRRIRPIFITTITTFMGLIPAIYEVGGQDANMRPMAIVIAWGLVFATIMTMLFIPGFMVCLFDLIHYFKAKKNPST